MSDPAPPGGLNIGFGNYIPWWRVVAILMPNSAPAIRFMEKAEREGKLITVCAGRKRRSLIITDTNQVIVSMVSTETLMGRLDAKRIEEDLKLTPKPRRKQYDKCGIVRESSPGSADHEGGGSPDC